MLPSLVGRGISNLVQFYYDMKGDVDDEGVFAVFTTMAQEACFLRGRS